MDQVLHAYGLKSPQSVQRILIIDRATWVDLHAFVLEHPRDKVDDPDTTKCEGVHTSRPTLDPRLLLSTQLWVSRRPEPKTSDSVVTEKDLDSTLTKWLSQ